MKTELSDYMVSIKVCCASCAFKELDKGSLRICTKGHGCKKSTSSCSEWKMRKGLENAGKGGGKIKKQSYIKFFAAERIREEKQKGEKTTVAQKREKYEKLHGDIYVL